MLDLDGFSPFGLPASVLDLSRRIPPSQIDTHSGERYGPDDGEFLGRPNSGRPHNLKAAHRCFKTDRHRGRKRLRFTHKLIEKKIYIRRLEGAGQRTPP